MMKKELLIKYYKNLINSVFKILPIFENLDFKTKTILNRENGFRNFQVYIGNLLVEVHGNSTLFFCSSNSIKLVGILRGMLSEITIDDHKKVKSLTMECINICKKIIQEIEKEGEDIGL